MGGASPVLARAAAGAVLFGGLLAYYIWQSDLPQLSLWGDIGFVALTLMPAVFALVWCALPLRGRRWLFPVGIAGIVLFLVLQRLEFGIAANFLKLGAMTVVAFWFLGYFESVVWVALVAAIVPWVDAYSVWRGPTKEIVNHHAHVFTTLSFAFPVPGGEGALSLGLPDLLFFALFLAAAARWRLRVTWTWLGLTASLGATMALAVWLELDGLPALPGLALGFLLPNADLIWRDFRAPRTVSAK